MAVHLFGVWDHWISAFLVKVTITVNDSDCDHFVMPLLNGTALMGVAMKSDRFGQ